MSNNNNGSIVVASSMSELDVLAKRISSSTLIPVAYRGKPDDCFVAMLLGNELGIAPLQAINNIDVVEGRPSPRAKLRQALAERHPDCEYFRLVSSSDTEATFETKKRSHPAPVRLTFTIEQATKAGLTRKATYQQHPAAMLVARCSARLADWVYPSSTLGLPPEDYTEEIASSIEAAAPTVEAKAIDITPKEEKKPTRADEVRAELAAKKAEAVQDADFKSDAPAAAQVASTPAATAAEPVEKPKRRDLLSDPKPSPAAAAPSTAAAAPAATAPAAPAAAPGVDYWEKAQALAKLRGLSSANLKSKLKELGAAGTKSVNAEIYAKLEAMFPAAGTQAAEQKTEQPSEVKDGDLF